VLQLQNSTAPAASADQAQTSGGGIEDIICQAAATYGQDCSAMIEVAICGQVSIGELHSAL